ncbi:MAG: single-stranded DNA-binding protein [Verrucomicrobiae bacterium]|nr:single-stranded DNA-binding protein [Verrucomicrobiae bacterium]MCP5538704.1 single-stranded DNA-binding protein [Akkermansiaceae bacterium]
MSSNAEELVAEAGKVCRELAALDFGPPTTHTYNPLVYARAPHEAYLRRFGAGGEKRVLFLGMNPGPWGMAQTGVPFGEIAAVRDWMGIEEPVGKPDPEHPKRPIEGFACVKSEVSGRRLWGLFADKFPEPERFFRDHFVLNYCPLVWMEASGKNRTPDKLPAAEIAPVTAACDRYLKRHLEILRPRFAIGVGGFAEQCLQRVSESLPETSRPVVGRVLHPSPASPAANRGWAAAAEKQLHALGVWE